MKGGSSIAVANSNPAPIPASVPEVSKGLGLHPEKIQEKIDQHIQKLGKALKVDYTNIGKALKVDYTNISKLHTKGIYWVHHIAGITEDMTLDDVCDKIKGHRLALTLFRNKGAVEAQISILKTDAERLFNLQKNHDSKQMWACFDPKSPSSGEPPEIMNIVKEMKVRYGSNIEYFTHYHVGGEKTEMEIFIMLLILYILHIWKDDGDKIIHHIMNMGIILELVRLIKDKEASAITSAKYYFLHLKQNREGGQLYRELYKKMPYIKEDDIDLREAEREFTNNQLRDCVGYMLREIVKRKSIEGFNDLGKGVGIVLSDVDDALRSMPGPGALDFLLGEQAEDSEEST